MLQMLHFGGFCFVFLCFGVTPTCQLIGSDWLPLTQTLPPPSALSLSGLMRRFVAARLQLWSGCLLFVCLHVVHPAGKQELNGASPPPHPCKLTHPSAPSLHSHDNLGCFQSAFVSRPPRTAKYKEVKCTHKPGLSLQTPQTSFH